jgi:hypothetical protein
MSAARPAASHGLPPRSCPRGPFAGPEETGRSTSSFTNARPLHDGRSARPATPSSLSVGKGQRADAAWTKKTDESYTYWGSGRATAGLPRTLPPTGADKREQQKD